MSSTAFGQSSTAAPSPSTPIEKSLARAWSHWESWPTLRESPFQDSSRLYFSLQVFSEPRSLLVAAGAVSVRNSKFQKQVVVFRDTGSWVSPPLAVADPRLPKPVSDGCGSIIVFWAAESQRGDEIWFARLKADQWSAPKRIPSLPRQHWGANQNNPIRLPGCRVAVVLVARDTTTGEYQHRLVVVADSAIAHVRAIASDGNFSQSDLAQQGRTLTYAYMRHMPPARFAVTFLRSIDQGETWKRVRDDTLPPNSIAQSIHMITVGEELWFGRVEGQDFAARGERRFVIGPLARRTNYSTTFVDDGGFTDYFMTGSACNAPTLVRLTGDLINRIALFSFDGSMWHEREGPKNTFGFSVNSRARLGRSVEGMAVVIDTAGRPPTMKFFRTINTCNR
jgi:hypothetical protein